MLVLLPLILLTLGALAPLFLGRQARAIRLVSLVFSALALVAAVVGIAQAPQQVNLPWLPALGLSLSLQLDGLSMFLVALTALATLAVVAFSDETERPAGYYSLILLMAATAVGTFLSTNLLVFYVFWELMIIPGYLLIGTYGQGPDSRRAALKFLVYSLVPSAFLLVAIVTLAVAAAPAIGHLSFNLDQLLAVHLPAATQNWIFLLFAASFMVKVPIWPLHAWMPDAYGESRPQVAAMLSGVLSKTGLYALIRFAFPLLPEAARLFAPALAVIALISILYGAWIALTHRDGRMVIAYSSLSHLGLVFLGVVALNALGLDGAVLQMLNHGIYAVALFLLFGMVEEAAGTRLLAKLGGVAGRAALFAGFLWITVLAALGLPGLNGFAGEFLLLLGIFRTSQVWAWIAIAAVIFSAAYFIRLFQLTAQGATEVELIRPLRLSPIRFAVLVPFVVLMVYIGFAPAQVTSRVQPVAQSIARLEARAALTQPVGNYSWEASRQ